jgi:putative phosphoribosyl transferase
MIFRDRLAAGRLLADALEPFRAERPVVLGLARGGMPVAFEVARRLGAALDVMIVRKIGAPGSPEYALGAIAESGAVYVNRETMREFGVGDEWLANVAAREGAELARRTRAYRGERPMLELAGRTVIVVDDGVATGATARAAGRAARQLGAARVVLAVPVIAAASATELRPEFDVLVAIEQPEAFFAVSQFYERFEQLSDEDVVAYLQRAAGDRSVEVGRLGAWPPDPEEEARVIPFEDPRLGPGELEADLVIPEGVTGLVMFVHGSGSSRQSPRNRFVARVVQEAGLATLLLDLLTAEEAAEDAVTSRLRFDIRLLTHRVLVATRWLGEDPRTRTLPLGYFGASTGAAAALAAAARLPERVAAIVSRGGRPDLVDLEVLRKVRAPVLLVVGGKDEPVLHANRAVVPYLASAELTVVPGATHLFEEPGTLGTVASLAARWFGRHLAERAVAAVAPAGG